MKWFDNLQVTQTHGRIKEENHYYAYGLKIACISSRKLGDAAEGSLKNNNLYNDKELNEDADLDWYDYGFRSYDPQIGRFPQLDPLTDSYPELSPYQYASNDPIANIDIDGLEGGLSTTAATAKTLETVTVHASGAAASAGIAISTALVMNVAGKIAVNIVVPAIVNVTSSVGTNQVGGKILVNPEITNKNYLEAIDYVRQSKEFKDIFEQFTNGSLGNTDLVFDQNSDGGDIVGHTGIFSYSEDFGDFSYEISEYIHNKGVEASQLSADMHLQVKIQVSKIFERSKTDVGFNVETLTHEMFLHLLDQLRIIKFLRSGASSESVLDEWYKQSQAGGYMNDDNEHRQFVRPGSKIRIRFDKAIRGLLKIIKKGLHIKQLKQAVSDDVKSEKTIYHIK